LLYHPIIAERMRELVLLGMEFLVDDDGIGYTNLMCLVHFSFTTVKLDKALLLDFFSAGKIKFL